MKVKTRYTVLYTAKTIPFTCIFLAAQNIGELANLEFMHAKVPCFVSISPEGPSLFRVALEQWHFSDQVPNKEGSQGSQPPDKLLGIFVILKSLHSCYCYTAWISTLLWHLEDSRDLEICHISCMTLHFMAAFTKPCHLVFIFVWKRFLRFLFGWTTDTAM